jgi:hypothetical protein
LPLLAAFLLFARKSVRNNNIFPNAHVLGDGMGQLSDFLYQTNEQHPIKRKLYENLGSNIFFTIFDGFY